MKVMKKPIKGEAVTIRYNDATIQSTCSEVVDVPHKGPTAARFVILSKEKFGNGRQAYFMQEGAEAGMIIESVITDERERKNRVTFYGLFPAN
jgi:hypothetical protein